MQQSDLQSVTQCTCAQLRQATRAVTQLFDEALQPSGLRATQFTLLAAVALSGATPISQLAEMLVTDRTTLTRTLKPLERDGLLASFTGEDRRTRLVQITDAGQTLLEEALPLWQAAQTKMVEGLGRESWLGLLTYLSDSVAIAKE